MQNRIATITSKHPWLVYEQEGKIAGYAYATQWKQRAAYRYAAESSIYVGEAYIGIGIEETICRFVAQAKGAGHPYSDRRGSLA